jgi:hypothetical protein
MRFEPPTDSHASGATFSSAYPLTTMPIIARRTVDPNRESPTPDAGADNSFIHLG